MSKKWKIQAKLFFFFADLFIFLVTYVHDVLTKLFYIRVNILCEYQYSVHRKYFVHANAQSKT